jgi:hypothetical protein
MPHIGYGTSEWVGIAGIDLMNMVEADPQAGRSARSERPNRIAAPELL